MAKKKTSKDVGFDKKLVLFNYLLGSFGIENIKFLGNALQGSGLDEIVEGQTGYYRHFIEISSRFYISDDKIKEYDYNIVRHLNEINKKRPPNDKIKLKYFQYFTLLFIEYYLDCYASDKEDLCGRLNSYLRRFLSAARQDGNVLEISPFAEDELNKIAVWNATGSGKTLLMHINILQARHYLDRKNTETYMLLTPNEGLSEQHLNEFADSGIDALRFNKANNLYNKQLTVIEVTKLAEQNGEEIVAVDSFGGKNILFVDEGHTGASGEKWMKYRKRLCNDGFSFEYSATFGQAVAGKNRQDMQNEYAKCIIFDYSYKYFYEDGYGKDYHILNLPSVEDETTLFNYLSACLLVFYQQKALFKDLAEGTPDFNEYHIESPLLVFVGSTVNAVRTENKEKVSDVARVVLFLQRFIENKRGRSTNAIQKILNGETGLLYGDADAFENTFPYLRKKYNYEINRDEASEIFANLVFALCGGSARGTALHIDNLSMEGEISLSLGDSDAPFGLINVGDSGELTKLLGKQTDLVVGKKQFARSLFSDIQKNDSTINILIGSKKFTAGWNCYRVSSMGLMYVGQSEGSEIIQLFGRGVRLWGYKKSLQRSSVVAKHSLGLHPPEHLSYLETLNIFGVKANYMQQFNEYLSNEGLPPSKTIAAPRAIPVLKNRQFKKHRLQKLALPEGINYLKDGPVFIFDGKNEQISNVHLDCYTALEIEKSLDDAEKRRIEKNESDILHRLHNLFDYDALYCELVEYKDAKNYRNTIITKGHIRELFSRKDHGWHTLFLPPSFENPASVADINRLQEYALRLLKKHLDIQYAIARNKWEAQYLRYFPLEEDDENFIEQYEVILGEKENNANFVKFFENLVKQLNKEFEEGTFRIERAGRIGYYNLSTNLYNPLLRVSDKLEIIVKPLPLNDSEIRFIEKFDAYQKKTDSLLRDYEVYLIRNKANSGIGFFETSYFYPDFILWIIDSENSVQHIVFIEPHGLGHEKLGSPKIALHTVIKEYEMKLAHTAPGIDIQLHSYILTPTKYDELGESVYTKDDYKASGVYFFDDEDVLDNIFSEVLSLKGSGKA
jgi:hypothetical protein